MDFMSQMQLLSDNTSVTENGMPGFKTTFHPIVDMNFFVSSYRGLDETKIINDFNNILESEDSKYALRFLFYIRDIRNGLGERCLFRVCLKELTNHSFKDKDDIFKDIVYKFIPTFGRFDDLFILLDTKYKDLVITFVKETLNNDLTNMKNNKPISLLAKWMPSENTSSIETRNLARFLQKELGFTPKTYRKTLSSLRSYLRVTEVLMSSNRWNEINYNEVSSNANLKYADAFLRNDEERRLEYFKSLKNNTRGYKINSSVLFPHEIVHKYLDFYQRPKEYNESLELLWKNLKTSVGLEDTIVVRDGSYSMYNRIAGSSTTCIDVSTALALCCSERLKGYFKDCFVTFSRDARVLNLSKCKSLQDKLARTMSQNDCWNTNLDTVFSLILNVAYYNNVPKEELPKQILIISDMEFDPSLSSDNVIYTWTRKFRKKGYELPKLIFWNVYSRTLTIPTIKNEKGLVLISGFSMNVLDQLTNSNDSYNSLINLLEDGKYSNVPLLDSIN